MKIAFFGYDFFYGAFSRLVEDEHEIVKIFSFPADNLYNFNMRLTKFAAEQHIPLQMEKPVKADLADLEADLFLSMGYPYKIPLLDESEFRGVNLHPSLLPAARGVWPLPIILLFERNSAGLTFHKLSPGWDEGDILLQRKIELTGCDDLETLSARCQMLAPSLLAELLSDFDAYWTGARPQSVKEASYYPVPSFEMRTFDFNQTIEEIDRTGKAFGRFECNFYINGEQYWVKHYAVWPERHKYEPGSLVWQMSREVVIAAKNGFVCIKDYEKAVP